MLAAAAIVLALQANGPVLQQDSLRELIDARRKSPEGAQPARFRLDLPVVSDHKTDLGSLQNPVGWSYDPANWMLTLSVDFGAVTPENYKGFDSQHLERAPPLRTVFFESRISRDRLAHRSIGISYGLAVPTATKAHGARGGDLPDDFSLPFALQIRLPPSMVDAAVHRLRLRVEGELRTIGGRAVLCSDSVYDGYGVKHSVVGDRVVETEPVSVMDYMCLAPAVITHVALVRTDSGTALHEWRRASTDPTPETAETAVTMVTDHRAPQNVLGEPNTATVTNLVSGPVR